MTRRPLTSPWTPELDEKLKLLATQGSSAIRACAALRKPLTSVRMRARMLGLDLPGVREQHKRIRLLDAKNERSTTFRPFS
jgi:hypothetical protein